MPIKLVSNGVTGEVTAVEMTGDEIADLEAARSDANVPPPPSDADLYGEYLDMVQEVSSDVGVQILSEIVRGLLR